MAFSLVSRIVHRLVTPASGEIIVKEQLGKHTLLVKGIPQSGGVIRETWKKGIKALPRVSSTPHVLLLGLGGGSAVHLFKKRWPRARILAVEIDPKIVVIARTYFDLDKVSGLKIITDDALEVIRKKKHGLNKTQFDFILVDIYLGRELPKFVEKENFINELKSLLSEKGVLVFNYLLDKKGKEAVYHFEEKLKKIFPKIKTLQTASNELIFAYQGR